MRLVNKACYILCSLYPAKPEAYDVNKRGERRYQYYLFHEAGFVDVNSKEEIILSKAGKISV